MIETDMLIIGAGAAGMTAAMYAKRANLDVILLDQYPDTDQQTENKIKTEDNYHYINFGGVTADELVSRMEEQLKDMEIPCHKGAVRDLFKGDRAFHVSTDSEKYLSKAVVVASGAKSRALMVPGEKEFMDKGISYCAVCDAPAFKGKDVVIVGGGDDAFDAALFMARLASQVTVVHDQAKPMASDNLRSKVEETDTIEIRHNFKVMGFMGNNQLETVLGRDQNTGETINIPAEGAFIHIGYVANSRFLKGTCDLNAYGFVRTNREYETNVKGLYACGDVIEKKYRYFVTAISDGAIAAMNAIKYIDLYF